MRNSDLDDSMKTPEAERTSRRRKQALAGAAGLAVLMGGGAVAATQWAGSDSPAAPAPVAAPAAAGSAAAPSAKPGRTAATPTAKAAPKSPEAAPSLPKSVAKRIADARAAAAKEGVPVKRPIPQPAREVPDDAVTVHTAGSITKDRETMRVVSARADLSGQRELAWVADGGRDVGGAKCSQTVKLANTAKPEHKPTLLICWRTSAAKSVYTVVVDLDGKPSERKSMAAIDAEWKKLS